MSLEKVLMVAPRGFCAGVVRAVDVVEEALQITKPVYVRKEIVHNKFVFAQLRSRGAIPEQEIAISSRGTVFEPSIAMDRFGNGIAAWTTVRNGRYYVAVSAYSALAPVIARMRVGRRALRFRANEIAAISIKVRRKRGGRSASQLAIARRGTNSVKLNKRVRRLLKRKGRYVATIRTRDAGPRRATYKVRFRRR